MGPTGRPEPGPRQENTPHLTGRGSSAGGGYSTLGDMLKFGQALVDHKLLNQQYTDIVLSNQMPPGQPPFGYGFFSVEVNGTRAIGNNGGGPGTNATFTVYPELGYTVVVLSNYDPPDRKSTRLNSSHSQISYAVFCLKNKTANGRLHFHAVHFMRTLPTGSVDPNFGRRVRNRRQLNSLQNTWPYGYSMPIAVRYTQDAFSRSGWLWPVDAKGEPLKATSYMAV